MGTIKQKLDKLSQTKAAIKQAIADKGVADVGDKFADYPAKIASIASGTDFGEFVGTKEYINEGIKYAKKIKDEWNVGNPSQINISKDFELVFFPTLDYTNYKFDSVNIGAIYMLEVGDIICDNIKSLQSAFQGNTFLRTIGNIDCPNCTNFKNLTLYTTPRKIKSINLASAVDVDYCFNSAKTAFLRIKNLGKSKSLTSIKLEIYDWGDDDILNGAKQSLIETFTPASRLKDGLYDRVTAGYETMTIKSHYLPMGRLTEEQKAEITALGYTILL